MSSFVWKPCPVSTRIRKNLSNQIIGVQLLIGQLQNLVEECGDPVGFDAAKWLGDWAFNANDALGGLH
ncbi:hypothetical protein ABEQ93_12215, partial [Cutibacterium acnes]